MKIVIDIPEGMLDELRTCKFPIQDAYRLCAIIENGTPLPKGHGRLIDADELEELFREVIGGIAKKPEMSKDLEHMVRASAMTIEMIGDAPIIIEADKEEAEE